MKTDSTLNLTPGPNSPRGDPRRGLAYLLVAVVCLLFGIALAQAADVRVSWDPVSDTRVVGYEVHYGTDSGQYGSPLAVANNQAVVSNLQAGNTYYFAVKAHGLDRNFDSALSEELSTTIPHPAPVASFSTDVNEGMAPLKVAFSDASSGPVTSWFWEFGDGATSTSSSPTHIFEQPGSYDVVLTVVGPGGTSTTPKAQRVVAHTPPPAAAFTESVTSGTAPLTVVFRDVSNGVVDTAQWQFGDGGSAFGSEAVWTYTTPGTYGVSLTVNGPGGSDTVTKPALITVAGVPPQADFDADRQQGIAPLEVAFQARTHGEVSGFAWDFGDGNSSTEANPGHRYTRPGQYDVALTVTGPYGTDTHLKRSYITADAAALVIESGAIEADHTWQWVPFERDFIDPIVIANPPSFSDAEPAVVRIDGITPDGFWIRIQEWDYLDGLHAPETVGFLAVERGRHQLPSGEWIEADRLNASGRALWDSVGFAEAFGSVPVVLTSVASVNLQNAVTARVRNVSPTGFTMRLMQQESTRDLHGPETVNYIAWPTSSGTVDGLQFDVGLSNTAINHLPTKMAFGRTFHGAPTLIAAMQTTMGGDPAVLRWNDLGADGVTLRAEEERSLDNEVFHAMESVGWAAFMVAPFMEVGEVTVDHTWQWVPFERDFIDPIVIANPPSFNNSDPAVVRIDGITSEGFWIRIQEWDYLDGYHAFETVGFLAVERGRHQLPSGEWIEADRLNASGRAIWDRVGFAEAFESVPVVLTSVASVNVPNAVTTRLNRISITTFDVRLQQQEATANAHGAETVTYIAWEPSAGTVDGLRFKVGRTANVVNHTRYALHFDAAFADMPVFLADMQSFRGGETAALRATNLSPVGVEVWAEEERSLDQEVNHALESVGWAVFE